MDEIERIIRVTEGLKAFWSDAHGWAHDDAADLLAAARLDRQLSFAHTLRNYLEPFPPESAEALQIQGYVSLRSMSEGALKLFFGVWLHDYLKDPAAIKNRKGKVLPPQNVNFDKLIGLFQDKGNRKFETFLRRVQSRGNAIHHFNDRDTGTQEELKADICEFLEFLLAVNMQLPYPDRQYDPANTLPSPSGEDGFC